MGSVGQGAPNPEGAGEPVLNEERGEILSVGGGDESVNPPGLGATACVGIRRVYNEGARELFFCESGGAFSVVENSVRAGESEIASLLTDTAGVGFGGGAGFGAVDIVEADDLFFAIVQNLKTIAIIDSGRNERCAVQPLKFSGVRGKGREQQNGKNKFSEQGAPP